MLKDFLNGCAKDAMENVLMTVVITLRGRAVRCSRDTHTRSGRYETGGLASIGNCYLSTFTETLAEFCSDISELLGEVVTMDGKGWRIFGVQIGDVMTQITLQRDTESG